MTLTNKEIDTAIARLSEDPSKRIAIQVADVKAAVVACQIDDALERFEAEIEAMEAAAERALATVRGL